MLRYVADVLKLQIRRSTLYRANLYFSAIAELIPLVGLLLYLGGAFRGVASINGYSDVELTTYYFLGFLLSGWVPTVWYEVGLNIRTGDLNTYLLRPPHYLVHFAVRQLAVSLVYVVIVGSLGILVCLAFPGRVTLPPNPGNLLLSLAAALMAFQLAYQLGCLAHLSAFWLDDLKGILSATYLLQTLLSGQVFPIDFLPSTLASVTKVLPFAYIYWFPARVYLGTTAAQQLQGFAVMGLWIIVTGLALRALWSKGLRVYHARGG